MTSEVGFRKNESSRLYDAFVGDRVVGSITYELFPRRVVLVHTFVDPECRNNGVASRLASFALDDVRAGGNTVTPQCDFVADYVAAHPEYTDLVDGTHPGRAHRRRL